MNTSTLILNGDLKDLRNLALASYNFGAAIENYIPGLIHYINQT